MFSLAFIRDNFTFILSALPVTLTITLLSLLFSTLLGAALAWAIIRQVPGVQWLARVFLYPAKRHAIEDVACGPGIADP